MRLLARQLLTGIYREIATDAVFESERAFDVVKGTLINGDGIGQPLISRALKDMPGMTENGIRDSLSRLKASGDYARTLAAITPQIEAEAEAARRFRRYPWGVRQRRKLYKYCTF